MEKGGMNSCENPPSPASVWWDLTTFQLPRKSRCDQALKNVRTAVSSYCSCGDEIKMFVYGKTSKIDDSKKFIIEKYMGAELRCVDPENSLEALIDGMKEWATSVPPPANYMVVSGNKDLLSTLKNLHRKKYNILVAYPQGDYADLVAMASYATRRLPHVKSPASIWWDITTFPYSNETLTKLFAAVSSNCSHRGEIVLTLYGDAAKLPHSDKVVIFEGMVPKCIPATVCCLQEMIIDMKDWASFVPPPANYTVVSGRKELLSTLKDLQSRNYNIFVAHPDGDYSDLVAMASCVWNRSRLIDGSPPYRVCKELVPLVPQVPHSFDWEEEEKVELRTSVWWDLRTCLFPDESECYSLVDNICTAVYSKWPNTEITMATYGDTFNLPHSIKLHLEPTVEFKYTFADRHLESMINGMKEWARRIPPPANYMVVSGNKELLSTLKYLHSKKYNILVAHPDGDYADMVAMASYAWYYSSLINGRPPYHVCEELVPHRLIILQVIQHS
ncbi:hypothetical protein OROHE_009936 [Orobanche hederae]